MASEDIIINNIARTSIRLDELVVPNRTGGDNAGLDDALMDADDKSFGGYRPVVFINGYYVEKYLEFFELDMTGFLPEIRFRFTMGNPLFISVNYPKDGDIVSVYIRSWVSVYRPLRMDFNVLTVRSSPSESSEGTNITFNILGEARIPGLYNEVSKAFRNRTSYDTLFDVSQDLDLGFSSNDPEVVDSMTWICPNLSYYYFITNAPDVDGTVSKVKIKTGTIRGGGTGSSVAQGTSYSSQSTGSSNLYTIFACGANSDRSVVVPLDVTVSLKK